MRTEKIRKEKEKRGSSLCYIQIQRTDVVHVGTDLAGVEKLIDGISLVHRHDGAAVLVRDFVQ